LLRRFGHVELRERRLVLILAVLRLELCVGIFRRKLLNVPERFALNATCAVRPTTFALAWS
jgi:hypothetical protein